MTPRELLDLPLELNDAGAVTVREYLIQLLRRLFEEGESFSGKRPFGNSDWDYDLFIPMVKAGLIEGTLDEDGYVDDLDSIKGRELISAAIRELY